ncbi:MAG: archaeosine biosynthesis radical SAM protein RaSEA, partial [Candidatus Lokiarchaeota archaeon]|nr:archaeosine biosynthesis radical SAM protein RaSEA [Candidatus Lokiarchaeota archaeon]
ILLTRGCRHYYSDELGCTMCGYNNDSAGSDVPPEAIVAQFEAALAKHDAELGSASDVVIKIFNSGSFFDEREIPADAQEAILKRAAAIPQVREIAVESRPEFVDAAAARRFEACLRPGQPGEVGIGLETWNDVVRQEFINKGFTLEAFLQAHDVLQSAGIGTKAYVLLKPPFLDERAAFDDAVSTIEHLMALGVSTVSINPVAVHAHTVVERLWERGAYRPPWLRTVRLVLQRAFTSRVRDERALVICDPVGGGKPRGAHDCKDPECNRRSLDAIKAAIEAQAVVPGLDPLTLHGGGCCPCALEWLDEMRL